MRQIICFILTLVVFSPKNTAASFYEKASIEEIISNGPAQAVCLVLAEGVGYGSGTLVKHKNLSFVITAKHITNPTEVRFQRYDASRNASTISYSVKKHYAIEPDTQYNVHNDVSILFLDRNPADDGIRPLTLSSTRDLPGYYSGYGYGILLKKGSLPYLYHEESSKTLKKIRG